MPTTIREASVINRRCRTVVFGATLLLADCRGPSQPTPPPIPDPPQISCPGSVALPAQTSQPLPVTYSSAAVTGGMPPVTVTCSPASGSLFPFGATTVTCTAIDARQRLASCTFAVTVVPPPTIAVTRFVAFGDSITYGEDGTAPMTQSLPGFDQMQPAVQVAQPYPSLLQQDLISRYVLQAPTVQPAGKPGEAVTDPGTFLRFTSLMSTGQYDVVLIMEGANDLLETRDAAVEPLVIAGLQRMVRDAKSRAIRPYLATIPPEQDGCCPDRGISWRQVPDLNNLIRNLAVQEGVTLVDVYQALVGDVADSIGFDGLHPTAQGYTKIADTFFATLTQTLGVAQSRKRTSSPATATTVRPAPPVRRH
jgi:lysophospholipase L1-like esterase